MASAPQGAKTRSPNYPIINLEDALGKLRPIYEKQQRYPASREILAQLMGYSGLSGASAPVVSALAKYGLIEGYGETRRVSELGQDLMLHRKGDAEYTKALRTAASQPTFFRDLQEAFPTGLPSEHSLRAFLVKRGFNPKAIDGAVRAYRETIQFVESEAEDGGSQTGGTLGSAGSRAGGASSGGESGGRNTSPPPADPSQRRVILPLAGSSWATLEGPFPVTKQAWDQMMAVLLAMEPALVTSASSPSFASGAQPDTEDVTVIEAEAGH